MPNPKVNAKLFHPGQDTIFGERVQIAAIGGQTDEVVFGDNVQIGDDVRILAPKVRIGDHVVIHHHTTIYGYDEITIGDCTWIGQNVILNCTARLAIGRGCTISAYSNLWTHFSGGDPVFGSRFNSQKPASIGDDVWIGVQASIAPVDIGAQALVLAGSVVTKHIPPNTVWGGNPAVDLTAKLGAPFQPRSNQEKFDDMCHLLREYHASLRNTKGMQSGLADDEFALDQLAGCYSLGGITIAMADGPDSARSVFDVRDRSYSKLRTPEETGFMNFLLPLVKFYARNS